MEELNFTFTAPLWIYLGKGTWHFITLPVEYAEQVKFFTSPAATGHKRRGWGAVRVSVSIGEIKWETSMFPSKSANSYVLPIKAAIRKKAKIFEGDDVSVTLNVKTGL